VNRGTAPNGDPPVRGHARREWRIGETTDDTERTLGGGRRSSSGRRRSPHERGARCAPMREVRQSWRPVALGRFIKRAILRE
jgi:hypothetical protein